MRVDRLNAPSGETADTGGVPCFGLDHGSAERGQPDNLAPSPASASESGTSGGGAPRSLDAFRVVSSPRRRRALPRVRRADAEWARALPRLLPRIPTRHDPALPGA